MKHGQHLNPSKKTHESIKVPGQYMHTPSTEKLMSDVKNKPKYGKTISR